MKERDKKRLNSITAEFKRGFEFFEKLPKSVVIFGSARTSKKNKHYKRARELAFKLAKRGFAIMTGAGSGIMEAGNRGAKEAGGISIGLNIDLPQFQDKNKYITHHIKFDHFYTRKVMFTKYSFATIVFPGGYGTLDELFEQLTVLQNKKIPARPIIIIGEHYYSGLLKWIKGILLKGHKIDASDARLFYAVEDVDEAVKIIEKEYKATRKFFI